MPSASAKQNFLNASVKPPQEIPLRQRRGMAASDASSLRRRRGIIEGWNRIFSPFLEAPHEDSGEAEGQVAGGPDHPFGASARLSGGSLTWPSLRDSRLKRFWRGFVKHMTLKSAVSSRSRLRETPKAPPPEAPDGGR